MNCEPYRPLNPQNPKTPILYTSPHSPRLVHQALAGRQGPCKPVFFFCMSRILKDFFGGSFGEGLKWRCSTLDSTPSAPLAELQNHQHEILNPVLAQLCASGRLAARELGVEAPRNLAGICRNPSLQLGYKPEPSRRIKRVWMDLNLQSLGAVARVFDIIPACCWSLV